MGKCPRADQHVVAFGLHLKALVQVAQEGFIDPALGIPIGLTCSLVGMIQQVNGILLENSGDGIYSSSAVMLLTTLYGGVVSAVGYFFAGSGRPEPSPVKNHGV